jgi:hypothetical protein
VNACRILRVLNACRQRVFSIPLSYAQYVHTHTHTHTNYRLERLTIAVLIDRLIARRQWPLAIAACKHMRISEDDGVNRVLAHWAYAKVCVCVE